MGAKLQLLFVTSKFLGGKMKGICKSGLMALCYAMLYIIVSHDGNCYS